MDISGNAHYIYRIKRVLIYSLLSFIITMVIVNIRYRYQLNEIDDILFPIYFGIFFGILLGIFDDLLRYSRLSRLKYNYRTGLKIIIVPIFVFIILIIIALIKNSNDPEDLMIGEGSIRRNFIDLFKNAVIVDIFLLAFFITIFNEINLILGDNFLLEYVKGNFKGPVKEGRIFMFLDLKDSTTIAEEIGDIKFFELLNDCYTLLGTVSISHKAEIVKYVGDEAILTWNYSSGKNSKNCINLFYDFKNVLLEHQDYFQSKYNLLPRFSAAAHHGSVISAYLGSVKRQKDYSGDVMNTTARIEGMTTKYNAELLISEDLFIKLKMEDNEGEKIESIALKGKAKPINIYKIS